MTSISAAKPVRIALVAVFWLTVWHIAARAIDSSILLVGPLEVILRLADLLPTVSFWATVARSFGRIALGFSAALVAGVVLAVVAAGVGILDELLTPLVKAIRSVPVFSFIILVLIWADSAGLAAVVSFLMVMPIVYTDVREGITHRDAQLLEMAQVFDVPLVRRLLAIDVPGVWPYFLAANKVGLGLAWKSGISGEVIGLPSGTIGERMYQAKLFLSTADLFAWTLVVIILSFAVERAVLWLLGRVERQLERVGEP